MSKNDGDPEARGTVNSGPDTRDQEAEDTEQAKHLELLALFSSPSRWRSGRAIQPLQLMKEIISLQEGIPRRLREIRPAAAFPADIVQVLKEHSPRVLQFSGHGNAVRRGAFAGALAFETADGTIELPDPQAFITVLSRRKYGLRKLRAALGAAGIEQGDL